MASSRRAVCVVLFAAALAALPVALLMPGLSTGVLFLAPALVLLASLLSGTYVGEERLQRLAAAVRRGAARRRPRRAARAPACARRRVLMPRGGRLVATSLAVRPPPAALTMR